jgi:uncharacterized RDD family membrane protein YckC
MSDLLDDNARFGNNNQPQDKGKETRRADFGSRLGAYLLDGIFSIAITIFIVLMFIGFDTAALMQFIENIDDSNTLANALPFITYVAWGTTASSLLYASLEVFTGASFGKRLVGIRIGTQDARTAETGTYILRGLLKNLNIILLMLTLLSGLSIFSSISDSFGLFFFVSCLFALGSDRLALHDKIFGTAVYKVTDLDK